MRVVEQGSWGVHMLLHLEDKVALVRGAFPEQFLRNDGKPYNPSYSRPYHPKSPVPTLPG